jgi:hypothetical protein
VSIPLHDCQGGPPPSTLSSRPERKRRGGTCSFTIGHSVCAVGGSPSGSVFQQSKLQVPPLRLRSGRDDKVEGGGPPWQSWRRMERVRLKTCSSERGYWDHFQFSVHSNSPEFVRQVRCASAEFVPNNHRQSAAAGRRCPPHGLVYDF